jgi:hypothetical protein
MSAAEMAQPTTHASASPFGVLQASVFPSSRVETAVLLVMAVVGPILFFALGLAVRAPGPVLVLMLLVPTPAIEAVVALRYRNLWPAQEILGLINWETMEDWREDVGGKYPSDRRQIEEWLDRHAEGSVPATTRARILLLSGRVAGGRLAIASLPVGSAHERRRRADLEFAADALDGVSLDATAVDLAIRADPELSPEGVAAHLAYHAALKAVTTGGDGVALLIEARSHLGALPSAVTRRLWLNRLRYAVSSAVGAMWLWVCVVVALGTAGGAVWF